MLLYENSIIIPNNSYTRLVLRLKRKRKKKLINIYCVTVMSGKVRQVGICYLILVDSCAEKGGLKIFEPHEHF